MTSNSRKPKSKITFKIGSILTFCGVLTIFILLIFAKDEILTYNFVFLMFLIITVISLSIVVLGTVIGYDNESVYNLGKLMLIYGLFLIAFFAIFNFFEIISFELFILLSSLLIGVVFLLLIIGMALSKEKGKILVQVGTFLLIIGIAFSIISFIFGAWVQVLFLGIIFCILGVGLLTIGTLFKV